MMEEMVDIVDENDNVIGTVTRSEMRKKNLKHRSTFILVFNSKREMLVTKRTKTKDVYPGMYEMFHGGTVSHGETFEENAHKEIKEEVGIENADLKFHFKISYKDKFQNCIASIFSCIYDGEIKIQKEEVESYFFVSMDKLKKMIKDQREQFTPDGLFAFEEYSKNETKQTSRNL